MKAAMLQFFFGTIALLLVVRGVFRITQSSLERTPELVRLKRRSGYFHVGAALVLAAFAVAMSFVP